MGSQQSCEAYCSAYEDFFRNANCKADRQLLLACVVTTSRSCNSSHESRGSGPALHMTVARPADSSVLELVASITPSSSVSCLKDVTAELRAHLRPVLQTPPACSSKPSTLARQYGKPLIQLIKQAFGCLSQDTPTQAVSVLSELAAVGLQGLSSLRSALRGRPFENEVQRFSLVKRLSSMQQPAEARRHAVLLLQGISQHWPAFREPPADNSREAKLVPALSHLDSQAAAPEQALILLGAILQLYACLSMPEPMQLWAAWVSALTQATWTTLCWLRYPTALALLSFLMSHTSTPSKRLPLLQIA